MTTRTATTARNKVTYRIRKSGLTWHVSGFSYATGLYVVPNTTGTRSQAIEALHTVKAGGK